MEEENYADRWLKEDLKSLLEIKELIKTNPENTRFYNSHHGHGDLDGMIAIKKNLIKIQELYRECEKIALENKVEFFHTPGPEYGMGGTYKIPDERYPNQEGWHSSNIGC